MRSQFAELSETASFKTKLMSPFKILKETLSFVKVYISQDDLMIFMRVKYLLEQKTKLFRYIFTRFSLIFISLIFSHLNSDTSFNL